MRARAASVSVARWPLGWPRFASPPGERASGVIDWRPFARWPPDDGQKEEEEEEEAEAAGREMLTLGLARRPEECPSFLRRAGSAARPQRTGARSPPPPPGSDLTRAQRRGRD